MSNTPGPWKWVGFYLEGPSAEEVISGDEVIVSNHDDARLIASAPELLHELKTLVMLISPYESEGRIPGLATLNAARAAIAKAEGK